MDKNISFTSKINFVNYAAFTKSNQKGYNIGFRHDVPNIMKDRDFYTMGVRTCTGGGLVIPYREAEGFHFWDDLTNKKNFNEIVNKLFRFVKNPERGLLVGSKNLDTNQYSIPQFKKLKKVFQERLDHLTCFEEHQHRSSETNLSYSLDTDTWTINTRYWENKNPHTVKDINSLLAAFKHVKIAKGDRLFFNGKQVDLKLYPEIFTQ